MNIEEYRTYCLFKKEVTESIPFSKLPNVLVFKVKGEMFTGANINTFDSFSIKCVPDTIDELREQYNALEDPSYFSKKHWCKVVMDGSVSTTTLKNWLDTSYDLVVLNLTKKEKIELDNL